MFWPPTSAQPCGRISDVILEPVNTLITEGKVLPEVERVSEPSTIGVKANQIDPESSPRVDAGSFGSTPAEELLVLVVSISPVRTIGEQKLSPGTVFEHNETCDQFKVIEPRVGPLEWTRK